MKTLQLGMGWFAEEPGGLERVYSGLVGHLPQEGVAVGGLVAASSNVDQTSGGQVHSFARADAMLPRRLIGARAAICQALSTGQVDLVASHFALYTWPAIDIVRRQPLVVHFHGPWAAESGVERRRTLAQQAKLRIESTVYRRAQRLIVLSEAFSQVLIRGYGVPGDRIRVIPAGIDPSPFAVECNRHHAREALGWPKDRPILLSVRRLARRMGLENLIEAISLVRRIIPDILLLIIGRGALQTKLEQRVRELGLENHIRLLGFMADEELPLAYRAADLTIVPSIALEGFGLTTIESLASGTPVLVTPIGGLPEVVRDLSENLVLNGSEPAHLHDGLQQALKGARPLPSPEDCRAYVEQRFTWPVIARRVKAVYEEALA